MANPLLLDLGVVLFFGFTGAFIAHRLGQSVIVGYIVVGMLIGPHATGLVHDFELIHSLAELGVVFLMFFLGLEFSLDRFRRLKNSVLTIGTAELVGNLSVGFLIGYALGWPPVDRLFLAGILAMSSSGVVAKLLFDMKRTATREAEVLMGIMVFEDFVAVIFLGILSGVAAFHSVQMQVVGLAIAKAVAFYSVFAFLGVKVLQKVESLLAILDSDELFVTLMLGLVVLAGAFAAALGFASAAGAFLLGMIINNSDLKERIHHKIVAFKDVFLVVFFLAFGMLINPRQLLPVLGLVAAIVPISAFTEVAVTSSAAFLSGFRAKTALAIGAGMVARGEYALIYATLGFTSGAISDQLFQFTAGYVLAMTLIAPTLMRNYRTTHRYVSRITPDFIRYGGKLVSGAMRPLMFPEETGVPSPYGMRLTILLILYVAILSTAFVTIGVIELVALTGLGLLVLWMIRRYFRSHLAIVQSQACLDDISQCPYTQKEVISFVTNMVTALLAILLLVASFWGYGGYYTLILMLSFTAYILLVSYRIYRRNQKQGIPPD